MASAHVPVTYIIAIGSTNSTSLTERPSVDVLRPSTDWVRLRDEGGRPTVDELRKLLHAEDALLRAADPTVETPFPLLLTLYIRTVPSAEAVNKESLRGVHAIENTQSLWPFRVRTRAPDLLLQIMVVLSHDPVAIALPSGLHTQVETHCV